DFHVSGVQTCALPISYIESITKRIRHQDRFTYFALKYIDEKKLFEKIRFQIDLGKIILDEYSKTLNGEEETRRVVENAKAFGRLQDLQDEEKIVASINKTKSDLQFEQFAPHYNLDNNKIGVSFKDETPIYISSSSNEAGKAKTNLKQPVVEAFLSVHDLHKV